MPSTSPDTDEEDPGQEETPQPRASAQDNAPTSDDSMAPETAPLDRASRPAPRQVAPPDIGSVDERNAASYKVASDRWNATPQRNGAQGVLQDIQDVNRGVQADIGGRAYTPNSAPPAQYLDEAYRENDAEARQAMIEAHQQATLAAQQDKQDLGDSNDQRENQFKATGQKYFRDSQGVLQPVTDPTTNQPLFGKSAWSESVNPKTGEPAWEMRDEHGQRQFRAPPLIHNPDLSDNHAYYKMPGGKIVDSGKDLEDFTNHKDPQVRMMAYKQIAVRNAAQRKEAYSQAKALTETQQAPYNLALQRINDLSEAQAQADAAAKTDTDPAQRAADQSSSQSYNAHIAALRAQIAPGSKLYHDNYAAGKNLQLLKAQHDLAAFQESAAARQEALRQNPNNPAAQQAYQNLQAQIEQQKAAVDQLTDHTTMLEAAGRKIQSTGTAPNGQPADQSAAPDAEPSRFQSTEPIELAKQGVKSIGAYTPQELAQKYGSGQGPVKPASLIQMAKRVKDLNNTLEETNGTTNIDASLKSSMTEERDYLQNLYKQRYAQLTPAMRTLVDNQTRDPSLLESIGGAAQSFVRGAANAATDIGEGLGRGAVRGVKYLVPGGDVIAKRWGDAAQRTIQSLGETVRDADNQVYNGNKNPQIAQKIQDSTLTGTIPEILGGLAPFVLGGEVAGGSARLAGASDEAAVALTRILSTAAGGAQGGTSLRNEAIAKLKPLLDSGKITKDQYDRSLGVAELGGSATGAGAMELGPISKFATRLAGLKSGNAFVQTLLTKAGKGGDEAAAKWVQSSEGMGLVKTAIKEGAQLGGITFGQTLLNDLTAQQSFDKDRKLSITKAGQEGGKMMLIGALTGALTHLGVKPAPEVPPEDPQTSSAVPPKLPGNPPPAPAPTPAPATPAEPAPTPETPAAPAAPAQPTAPEAGKPAETPKAEEAKSAAPAPEDAKAKVDKLRAASLPEAEAARAIAQTRRELRQKLVDNGWHELSVSKMTNEEVEEVAKRAGLIQSHSEPQSTTQSNENATPVKETVRDEAGTPGREGETGLREEGTPVRRASADSPQPEPDANGGGREGDRAQTPGSGRVDELNESGPASEPASRAAPNGEQHAPASLEARPGVQEEPRRDAGEPAAASVGEAQPGRGRGSEQLASEAASAGGAGDQPGASLPRETAAGSDLEPAKPQVRPGEGEPTPKSKPRKTKFQSVGERPEGGEDILNFIESEGGIQTKAGAGEKAGGEHDDITRSFTGRARLLMRKKGSKPDDLAANAHSQGLIPDGDVKTLYAAVEKAVKSRADTAEKMGKKELHDKFDRAFYGNEHPRKWLRAGKPISIDDLNVGDKFNVNKDEFTVKSIDETTGAVTIKDGITKVIPAGSEVYPDKGVINRAKDESADFDPFADETPAKAEPEPAKEPEAIKAAAKKAADTLRKLKTPKGGLKTDISLGTWDAAIEAAARTIEAGGNVSQAVANAIKRMKALRPDATDENAKAVEDHIRNVLGEPKEEPAPAAEEKPEGTSAKHASTEALREKHGMAERAKPEPKSDETLSEEAKAAVAADPEIANKIINRVLSSHGAERTLTDKETVILAHHINGLDQEAESIAKKGYSALEGDKPDKDAAGKHFAAYAAKMDEMTRALSAAEAAGSAQGSAFRARQLLAANDFSLKRITNDKRMANNGADLSEADKAWVSDMKAKFDKVKAEYEARLKEQDERASLAEMDNAHLRAMKKIEDERKAAGGTAKVAPKAIDRASLSKRIDDAAEAAKQRFLERSKKVFDVTSAITETPGLLKDAGIIAAKYIKDGIVHVGQFAAKWRAEFGPTSNQDIFHIWNAGHEEHKNAIAELAKTETKGKASGRSEDTQGILELLGEHIKDPDAPAKPEDLHRYAEALHLEKIREGIHGREAVLDAVHEDLKQIIPDITRREARDAVSGYGRYRPLDMEAAKIEHRQLKDENQQISKLEDMAKGKAPVKTGGQRQQPSDEGRQLRQRVNEEKRKGGYDVTNPESQLKSALGSLKTRLKNQIYDLKFQIATGKKIVKTKTDVPRDAEATSLEKQRDDLQAQFDSIFKKPELTDEQRLRLAQKAVDHQITKIQEQMKSGAIFSPTPKKAPTSPQLEAARAQLEALKQEREFMRQTLQPGPDPIQAKEDALNQAARTRMARRTAELKDRQARGDFSPRPKPEPLKMSKETLAAKEAYERQVDEYQKALQSDRLAKRTIAEKAQDNFLRFRRAFILSRISTFGKLGSAAAMRIASVPLEDAAGSVTNAIMPKAISEGAPYQGGGIQVKALADATKNAWMKTLDDVVKGFKTGKDELDALHSKGKVHDEDLLPPSITNYVGRVHKILKAPAKRFVYEHSFSRRMAWNIDHTKGFDPSDFETQLRISNEAYKDANRSIFLADNKVSDIFQREIARLTQPDSKGKVDRTNKAIATAAQTLVPIIKVPTNIAAETLNYAFGHILAGGKLGLAGLDGYKNLSSAEKAQPIHKQVASAFSKGFSDLTPDQKDIIMRHMTKGLVGAGMMALGFFNPGAFGGYYQPGEKRDKSDVKWGAMKVAGHTIPAWALEAPIIQVAQMGATMRRVADSKFNKDGTLPERIADGTAAAALGVIDATPLMETVGNLDSLRGPEAGVRKFAGTLAADTVIPGGIQELAKDTDTDENGEQIDRAPKTFGENFKMGIPSMKKMGLPDSYNQYTRAGVRTREVKPSNPLRQPRRIFNKQ